MPATTTTASKPTAAMVEFVRDRPLWPVQFLVVYLGNPIVFLLYFFVMCSTDTGQDGVELLGMTTCWAGNHGVDDNAEDDTSRNVKVNFLAFVALTLPLYVLWFACQVLVALPIYLRRTVERGGSAQSLNASKFASRHCNATACLWSIPGLFAVGVWSTSAWEGSVVRLYSDNLTLVSGAAYVVMAVQNFADALEVPVGHVVGYHIHEDGNNDDDDDDDVGKIKTNGERISAAAALPAIS
jgi:hypothetical protein